LTLKGARSRRLKVLVHLGFWHGRRAAGKPRSKTLPRLWRKRRRRAARWCHPHHMSVLRRHRPLTARESERESEIKREREREREREGAFLPHISATRKPKNNPLSSEYGTYKTVKAWLSGGNPQHLSRCSLFARERTRGDVSGTKPSTLCIAL